MTVLSVSHTSKEEYPWQAKLEGGINKCALTREQLLDICPEAAIWLENNPVVVISEEDQRAKEELIEFRTRRNEELAATDHLMLPDAPISANELQAIIAYRRALRDYPRTKVWPVKPI